MNILLILLIILLDSCHPLSINGKKKFPLVVEQGKSAFLSQAHIPVDPKFRSAEICQIEVDDIQPLSSSVGFLQPKKFPCFFKPESVLYQHEGSTLISSDTILLNIYFFRRQYSSVHNVTVSVSIVAPHKPSRITLNSHLTVTSWKGISQAISFQLINIRYNPDTEFCRIRHLNQAATSMKLYPWLATRYWPMTGVLITYNKSKVYEFNLECQQALLMGFRFMHRKSRSSPLDFLPVIIEISQLDREGMIDTTYIHIPIYISSKNITGISENMLPPPVVKAFRTITLTNSGGTLSLLPSDCLELSSQDKERGPLIVQILNIEAIYEASFRNLRDTSKSIWSFTFTDLIGGLIAFQLQGYYENSEKIFRIDLIIMDSYFIKSDIVILKLIDVLENKDQPFQVFTMPFYTYTSSNRPLRKNNIQIVGDIDQTLVKCRIKSQNITTGSFYKYPSLSLVNKQQYENPNFPITDLKNDMIFFKHDGGLKEFELINVEVAIDRFRRIKFQLPIYIVRVYNRTKENLLDTYTEFTVAKEEIYPLNIRKIMNKNYYFYINHRDNYEVKFDILSQLEYGALLKLLPGQNINSSSTAWTSIRLQDLLDGLIFYQNNVKYKVSQDTLELKQQGKIGDGTVKIVFNIQYHVKSFIFSKMDRKIIFSVSESVQYKKLSYLNMNFVHHSLAPEDITYRIICFPRYENTNATIDSGRLISLKSIQNDLLIGDTALTTKITNYRSAHITSATSFTQKQILDNDIAFIPPLDDIGPKDRRVMLLYSVKDAEGYEIRNIPFTILIKAVNNQPPILNEFRLVVPRDEEIYFSFVNLDIRDVDTKREDVLVEFVTLPNYGSMFDGKTKIINNGYKFHAEKLHKKLIKYKHGGYNVNKDSFNIRLFDGMQMSSNYNVVINITKRVIPTSNWNLYINNSVLVKENSTVILHHSVFQNVLNTFDFKQFPNPMFVLVAMPTKGNIVNDKVVVSTFYYNEVKKGQIKYQHSSVEIGSKSEFDFTQVWVLENGESFNLNFTIQPVNSQSPVLYSQIALQVNEGGSVIISYYVISLVDLDSDEYDLFIHVISPPRWGNICTKGSTTPIKSFSAKDIKLGKIVYSNVFSGNGSEQTNDAFTIKGSDGEFFSSPLEIQIFIHSINDEPPILLLNDFNIAVGEKRILDETLFQISDADVPRDNIQITVRLFPKFGNLSLKYKYDKMKVIGRHSPPLTLQTLKFVSFVYSQSNHTIDLQSVKFPVRDNFGLRVTDGKFVVQKDVTVNITGFNRVSPIILVSLIQVSKTDEKIITRDELSAIDPDTLPDDIIFTILKVPEKGVIFLKEIKLQNSQTFTQKDIDNKQIKYKYTGPSVTFAKDFFLIKLFDGSFNSDSKQVFIFLTQPIQTPKMSISLVPIKVNIGRKLVIDKNMFAIENPVNDVVDSIVVTIKGKLTCGAFYYYRNLEYPITKFTFEDVKERRILLFISECAEVVKVIKIPISMFSHKKFETTLMAIIEIVPRINLVPTLKVNSSIVALVGSNLLLTKDSLLTVDEDTTSDKLMYKFIDANQSSFTLFVNKLQSNVFSQYDINAERVEIRVKDVLDVNQTNITLHLSDGYNEGYMFNTYYHVSGLVVIPLIFSRWEHKDLILLKFSPPSHMKFIDGYSAFKWSYDDLLVSRPDAQITVGRDLVAGFFYNIQSKQSISNFTQVDINRGQIYYMLHKEKSSKIFKEIIQFKIFYQAFRISSEILELNWSIIEFDKIKYKLCPQRGLLSINVTRIGNLGIESNAMAGFESVEAILNQDFRLMSQRLLIFAPGEKTKVISIKILMTGSVVKENRFQVTLMSPKQAVFGQKSTTTVSIKNRKTCGNKEYFLAEKSRKLISKNELKTNMKNMLQDFGYSFDDSIHDNDDNDLPSSDELDMQYKSFLTKKKTVIKCTQNWFLYSKRCYRPYKTKLSWKSANDKCKSEDSYLTTLTSDSVQLWLMKLFPRPRLFWTGLHRVREATIEWKYTNNEALLYKNWEKHFPVNTGHKSRDCVLVTKKGRWKNRPCHKKRVSFICMKNPEVTV